MIRSRAHRGQRCGKQWSALMVFKCCMS
jgi:hypothetical protein